MKRRTILILGGFLMTLTSCSFLLNSALHDSECQVCELKDGWDNVIDTYCECAGFYDKAYDKCRIGAYDYDDSYCDCRTEDSE